MSRAFSDCKEVRNKTRRWVQRASLSSFRSLTHSKVGPFPLPFFVKLNRYPKIRRELDNYRDCTTLFIPFYARPNIDPPRCLLGAARGLIVGNFVEQSDSLAELVERGTAQAAINSLFDDALRGWRTQAYLAQANTVTARITESLSGAIPHTYSPQAKARAESYAREARAVGAILGAAQIAAKLDNLPPRQHRRALTHGDLHGENIRVRSGQAILIDFAAAGNGPLVADPACLDVALAFNACTGLQSDEHSWRSTVMELYSIENVRTLPQPREPQAPFSHVWNSIRQVRRYGLAEKSSAGEYAIAVAVYLLRQALRRRVPYEDQLRRPAMVYLAEQLTQALSQ